MHYWHLYIYNDYLREISLKGNVTTDEAIAEMKREH